MMVRLIKGAYWDSEIKKSQMQGLSDYPVFTRKVFTDLSFQACAKKILTMTDVIYPQFATHNAYTVAMILNLVGDYRDFEFQCLHGMGTELYEQIVPKNLIGIPCRIYAPVGSHEDLLPYLVRRLLENGANSSFVNRIIDEQTPIENLILNPVIRSKELLETLNLNVPAPAALFMPQRRNSAGFDFTDRHAVAQLQQRLTQLNQQWVAQSLPAVSKACTTMLQVTTPQNTTNFIGCVYQATFDDCENALASALAAFPVWSNCAVDTRASMQEKLGLMAYQKSVKLWIFAAIMQL